MVAGRTDECVGERFAADDELGSGDGAVDRSARGEPCVAVERGEGVGAVVADLLILI